MWRNWNTRGTVGGIIQHYNHYEDSMVVTQKLKVKLPYGPAILILGIQPEEVRAGS